MADFAEKLKTLRRVKNLTQRELAKALGVSQPTVARWERGTMPEPDKLRDLAEFIGTSIEAIMNGSFLSQLRHKAVESKEPEILGPVSAMPGFSQMPRDLPVYGVAAASEGEDGFNIEATVVDFARRPPALETATDTYGLFVASDSMEPAFHRGDLIYVRPRLPPRLGDDVVVQVKPEHDGEAPRCFLKRLKRRTATKVIVEQFNPPKDLEFPIAQVIAIHRVLRTHEFLGT